MYKIYDYVSYKCIVFWINVLCLRHVYCVLHLWDTVRKHILLIVRSDLQAVEITNLGPVDNGCRVYISRVGLFTN